MKSTCTSLLEATIYMFTSYRATISMCTSCSERVQNIISVQQRGGLFGHLSVIPFRFLLREPDGTIDRMAMGTRRRATACARLPDLRYGTSMRVVVQALGVIRPRPNASILILLVLLLLDTRRFCRGCFRVCIVPIIHDFIRESGVPHTIVPVFCSHLRV